ncbi:MAG: CoA protein activase [Eubacteriales bacterium]|nr:CoA protein activase [Eubacteriales bacterium]
MKISFPHLGYCSIPLRSLFADLGHEVIVPPPITRKTISLGTRHGPEFACYPLKLGLGNFIEALELGADTLVMGGGIGPCRFGYYAQVQRDILQSLGYKFKMLVVEPPLGHARQVLAVARELKGGKSWLDLMRAGKLALAKLRACDELHRASLKLRPRVQDKPACSRLYQQTLEELDAAPGIKAVNIVRDKALADMEAMPMLDRIPPKVALVGEVYLIAEPAANLRIEEKLGNMGVEVCRHVWISEWLRVNIFLDFLRLHRQEKAEKLARPYLQCFVGGHGQHSVGETRKAIRDGFDGVVHIYPFTCTPEIVARGIIQKMAAQERMPLACFSMDEHSGEAGFQTRLEAFVDILGHRVKRVKEMIELG